MKRNLVVAMSLVMGMTGTFAHAAPRATYRWTDPTNVGAAWEAPTAANVSHTIYLNNCKPNGCTIHPGNDNATTDTSSIPNGNASVSAYSGSDANWQALMAEWNNQQMLDFMFTIGTYAMVAGVMRSTGAERLPDLLALAEKYGAPSPD